MEILRVENLCKEYGKGQTKVKALDNVSFSVEKGEFVAIVGASGSGKSTLLHLLGGVDRPNSGKVFIEGKELDSWDKKELSKKIAILKQSNNINIRLTIRELVSFGRFPYCEGKLQAEDIKYVEEAIEYMRLTDIQDKYLDELSGGQRQRAYIAMVIAQGTEYIFLDEPLNNLDMNNSVQMMKVLKKLCDELGKTIILVMHDINFTSCYSDYIICLKNGMIAKEGIVDEIINKETLEDIYEMDFDVKDIDGKKISIYY